MPEPMIQAISLEKNHSRSYYREAITRNILKELGILLEFRVQPCEKPLATDYADLADLRGFFFKKSA